jgi:hypothetical protein
VKSPTYEILVEGELSGQQWQLWFGDVTLTLRPDERTCIRGRMDQPALHGALAKVRDLGLTLVNVRRIEDP